MKGCTIESMTVDAAVHGNIKEVQNWYESYEYIGGEFRQPIIDAVYCGDCGEYLFEGGLPSEGMHSIIKQHLEE